MQGLLSVDLRIIFSVVVFVGDAKFKTAMPDNVVKIRDLLPYILSHNKPLIGKEDVDRYASLVISATTDNYVSVEDHVKSVRNNEQTQFAPSVMPQWFCELHVRAAIMATLLGLLKVSGV